MQTYRWSSEIEAQFLSLMKDGRSTADVARILGCSNRTASRRIQKHRLGDPQVATGRRSRPYVPKGDLLLMRFARLPDSSKEALRSRAITNASKGWSAGRIADAIKVPVGVVQAWVSEWGANLTAAAKSPDVVEADQPQSDDEPWWAGVMVWPQVTMSVDNWPAEARFEDDPRACRREPIWRPVYAIEDRMSYCSNATAWCAA